MRFFLAVLSSFFGAALVADEATIRSTAIIDLNFDEDTGVAVDRAQVGGAKNEGTLANDPFRVRSPFWGQKGKRAVQTNDVRRQYVRVADGEDVDQDKAWTLAFYCVNLTPPQDAQFRGLFGKRRDGDGYTNYAVNFVANQDNLQFYVNDTTQYRVGVYPMSAVIPSRKPVWVTFTFELADMPENDADTDADDLLMRVYSNGEQVGLKNVISAQALGKDLWLTDIKVSGLPNDVPFTLGSTNENIEHMSGIFDEFLLLPKALTPDEVKKLFLEVAGAPLADLQKLEGTAPPPPPELTSIVPFAHSIGAESEIVITGSQLAPNPQILIPARGVTTTILSAEPNQIRVKLQVAKDAEPGHYPLRVSTPTGISSANVIVVDRLTHRNDGGTAESPITLPTAVVGYLGGDQQVRAYFRGNKGDRIVADVESRRLGAGYSPVLELKTARGKPLAIQWGQRELMGDSRIETVLPAEGVYYFELHDLQYRAPGGSPFRLKVGDLKLIDVALPMGIRPSEKADLLLVGVGVGEGLKLSLDPMGISSTSAQRVKIPEQLMVLAPIPAQRTSDGLEVAESDPTSKTFDWPSDVVAVYLNGWLSKKLEQDLFTLKVMPGQRLRLQTITSGLPSALEPRIEITNPAGAVLAAVEDPGNPQVTLDFTVPGDLNEIGIRIRDGRRRGGTGFYYRVRVNSADRPDFSIELDRSRLNAGQGGGALARLRVNRAGYQGKIVLDTYAMGMPQQDNAVITISPREIPAGVSDAWVVVSSPTSQGTTDLFEIKAVGTEQNPPIVRYVSAAAIPSLALVPEARNVISLGHSSGVGLAIKPASSDPLPVLFKGASLEIPLKIELEGNPVAKTVQVSLLTTEAARLINPGDPNQGQKPRVEAPANQTIEGGETGPIQVIVPFDVAETELDCVIQGELVAQPFATTILGRIYSNPFRLQVKQALTSKLMGEKQELKGGTTVKLKGTIERTAGFNQAVTVELAGLPAGYTAERIQVPGDASSFELGVVVPQVAAAADIPNVVLKVISMAGLPLQGDMPVAVQAVP